MTEEQIVFVDAEGKPTGKVGPKLASHTSDTQIHLAFSCYIFRRSDNAFLMTQRAHVKKVWPDVWTNSMCGHPMPDETLEQAIARRAQYELGFDLLEDVTKIVPVYSYKTPPYQGIIEHEFCPIFTAFVSDEPRPNDQEVEDYTWLAWDEYVNVLHTHPDIVSYWAKDQYQVLKTLPNFPPALR